MRECYGKSIVARPFHATPHFLLYINYAGLLEVCNYLDESEKVAKEGIVFGLECQRGDVISEILTNLSCVYQKRGHVGLAETCLRYGLYLLELYQYEKEYTDIKETYENMYSEKLN